ncbi:MAG: CinA family protein, partial [Pseudomonadota bacterium]|nr:CinA family protein [Pseudomonadota bacterium]
MSGEETRSKLRQAVDALFREDKRIVTAESLTCGGIGAEIVKMPRVSDTIVGGFSVYNDDMKVNMLGVPRQVIDRFSAVSAQVAHYMA